VELGTHATSNISNDWCSSASLPSALDDAGCFGFVASLTEFLAILAKRWPDPSERGKRFEPYLCDALRVSPSHQFSNVWLWDDWPGRDGPDLGIDLVAEHVDGGLWGIQSKLYAPDSSLRWKDDLSTWVAATRDAPWTHRLLVSTTANLSPNAKRQFSGDTKTLMLLGEDLSSLPVEWPDTLDAPIVRVAPMVPREHQVEAISAVGAGFDEGASRLQAHMACGTGKTLVSLRVYERVAPELAVVLVPSLSLMAQTIRSWTANTLGDFRYLPVCSDVKVAEDERRGEDADLDVDDLAVLDSPATTDPDNITQFLQASGPRVVFSTYQSSDVLAAATVNAGVRFGLVVADEAHRTSGSTSTVFSTVLDDARFPADRRLFVTATPRTFAATADGDETVQSMDDTDQYGEVVYELGFGRAVELGLLADYEVVVIAVQDPELRATILDGGYVELDGLDKRVETSALVALEGTLRAIDKFDLSRLISFHSRIKRAKDFATAMPVFGQWREHDAVVEADTVDGTMNAAIRKGRISWLEDADRPRVLTNARCLTEGIDLPSLDAIVFADPKRSQTDIVQAVGRVMRTDPNNADKVGRIIIPLVVPDPDHIDGDNVFEDSTFKPVWDVIRALKAHDFRLETELNRLRGLTALGPINQQDFSEATHLNIIGIDDLKAFQLAVINRATPTFWWYAAGPLRQYVEREGNARVSSTHVETFDGEPINLGAWVSKCRTAYGKEKLSADRIAALQALPGWEWNPFEADFQRNLAALRQYVKREGNSRVPISHVETFDGEPISLGKWVRIRRMDFRSEQLSADRIVALEALPGWEWNPFEADFQRNLAALRQYIEREGDRRVPRSHVETFDGEPINLGTWVRIRRMDFRKGQLSADRIVALEALPGWEWNPIEADYQRNLDALRQYVKREGNPRAPRSHVETFDGEPINLGTWVHNCRGDYGRGKLSADRIAALQALPGWEWNPIEADYQRNLDALRQYVEREGNARAPTSHVETFDGEPINLGKWVSHRRGDYGGGNLSADRIAALEALPGWKW
jgi:superfamily II DNA or RNA helicase